MKPRTPALASLLLLLAACAAEKPIPWSEVRPPEVYVDTLPPGALVTVDGVEIGKGPLSVPVRDESRTYLVRVAAPGFDPVEVSLPGARLAGTRHEVVLRPVGFGTQRKLAAGEPAGLLQAALVLLRADRNAEALAYARASLAAGESALAHRAAGDAQLKLGNRNEAIREYSLYISLAPEAPDRKEIEKAVGLARRDIQMTAPKPPLE
jgi:tetratricopeptide (TPR) repeat protein